MSDQIRQRVRRKLGLEWYPALLGDANGIVEDHPGFARVRYQTSAGRGMKDVVLWDDYSGPTKPGTPVRVTYNVDGELCVRAPNVRQQLAVGGNPSLNNPSATRGKSSDENPFVFVPFTCHPTTPPSLNVVLRPWIYIRNNIAYNYAPKNKDDQIALSSFKPASGQHRMVAIFLKNDNTPEALASTAQSVTENFDVTDIQEILDAASPGSNPGWFWRLTGDATELGDADIVLDMRQFINQPVWYAYTPSGTADTYGNDGDWAYDDTYLYHKVEGVGWMISTAFSTF